MYLINIVILTIFLLGMIFCAGNKLSGDLKREALYLQPFFKLGAGLIKLRIVKEYFNKKVELKKQLLMLNPAKDKKQLHRDFEIRRVGKLLMLIFAGNILSFLISLSALSSSGDINGNIVDRNTYGGGDKTLILDIYADGEKIADKENIVISERRYTEEEIQQKFGEISQLLEYAILGENQTLECVNHNLELVNSLEGYPVSIEWELDNYSIIDGDGRLRGENISEEGEVLELTARMNYFGFQGEHRFNAVIYPPPLGDKEAFSDRVMKDIKSYEENSFSDEKSFLPVEIEGKSITYKEPTSNTGVSLLMVFVIACLVMYKAMEKDLQKEIHKRDMQMMMDYPQIVSKLSLLIGAGMTVQAAFSKLAIDYEKRSNSMRFAYEEMLIAVRQIEGGMSEGDAYIRFGNRCRLQKFVKLGALLSQNIKKGSNGLLQILETEEKDAFEERKSLARRLGEEAGTKLLAPMGLMLMIVIVIVVVPAFMSMK